MKTEYSDEEIDAMSECDACHAVVTAVYEACQIFERLQQRGKITGLGCFVPHLRQSIADAAESEILKRWIISAAAPVSAPASHASR